MQQALQTLLESGLVNEETRNAINEAWQNKIEEIRVEVRTEVREEFAGRYEHDKKNIVESIDKMVSETLTEEIKQVKEERIQLAKLKIQALKEAKNAAKKFDAFAHSALQEEITEFVKERKLFEANKAKLEKFIISSLAEEINEFSQDKKDLVETKVKLISEAKDALADMKQKFVARSSKAVSKIVAETLNHEITQFRDDIKAASKNNFGRKIFEAYASEFAGTHFNDNKVVNELKAQLEEANQKVVASTLIAESTSKELSTIKKRTERAKIVNELLSPLMKEKRAVMSSLLENVQTTSLRSAYDKYLPSVLSNNKPVTAKAVLHESTGDKGVTKTTDDESLDDIKRLAGLK